MSNKDIDFQFTALPTQLTMLLDVNCTRMMYVLKQLSDFYKDENGIFFRTNADLVQQARIK
jgi:hypothetical protein